MTTAPLKTFIIYARADAAFKDELLTHLHGFVENALIEKWVDSDLLPGEEWEKRIERELEAAHLVLMLVSADALKSEFIRKKELKTALEKKRAGNARVVPILVRDFFWELHPDLAELQFLPKDENGKVRGVAAWVSRDSAWTNVCKELFALIRDIRAGLEKEALELARRAAEETEKQREQTEREKAERTRQLRDEKFWKSLRTDAGATDDLDHRLALYESYLHDPEHRNHRAEAEAAAEEIQAEIETARRRQAALDAARRKREDAERQQREAEAAEKKRQEEETARLKKAAEAAEKKRQEEEAARNKGLPDMVRVQGGTFQMGEKGVAEPVHTVTLSDFEIGKYPVTQKLWQEIMGANPSHFKGCDDCPVESVSWDDIQAFLKKLNAKFPGKNYRLPTEAEWEYAARGGALSKGYAYAGGNDLSEVGWYWENSGDKPLSGEWKADKVTQNNCRTHPVGGKKANELGLHDMSGNVWEWCADWYGDYPQTAQTNPTGPTSGSTRVHRGGSWSNAAEYCRVSRRYYWNPEFRGLLSRLPRGFFLAVRWVPRPSSEQGPVALPPGAGARRGRGPRPRRGTAAGAFFFGARPIRPTNLSSDESRSAQPTRPTTDSSDEGGRIAANDKKIFKSNISGSGLP